MNRDSQGLTEGSPAMRSKSDQWKEDLTLEDFGEVKR